MLDGRWRAGVERGLGPLGAGLGRIGVTPDALTLLGLLFAVGTAFAVATGHLILGTVGIVLSGLGDLLDGNLARSSGRSGPRGSFFDSVTDRVSDAVVLGGVAWYLADVNPHLPVLAFAVAILSMLISYERAKAESLGLVAKGGLMERAERYIFIAIGLAFNVIVPVLWVMLVLTAFTALQRFGRVWRQAERPAVADHQREPRPRVRRTERLGASGTPRLRTWLDARAARVERTRRQHPARRRTRP
jgi:CDP-diacylglycerol--glycerol-3-phosphate 3-phosphatidyltransferase